MTRYFSLFTLLSLLSVSINHPAIADDPTTTEERTQELESLRSQIKNAESNIQAATSKSENLQKEIQKFETAAANVSKTLDELKTKITQKKKILGKLQTEQSSQELSLNHEQQLLAQQIRAAYKTGRNDYIKLLLNQEDPALVGRILAYHNYFNQARTQRIDTINSVLENITLRQKSIALETQELEKLQSRKFAKLDEYDSYHQSRKKTLTQLQKYAKTQNKQLQILQRNEEELSLLVEKLQQEESIVELYENMPPFDSLRGSLDWPIKGKFTHRFGQQRKGDKLKWQGVTIKAKNGADIRAISTGKVIFADWFRNMGLLLILDHGDGYMSLYGHNKTLVKKSGDWVRTGDIIAQVGDTGGQLESGLYFEIRKNGTPKNPVLWCQK